MKRSNSNCLLVSLCLLGSAGMLQPAMGNVYTVTSTADAGAGSLRQALLDANANPGRDTIRFQILAAGNYFEGSAPNSYAVIRVNTALPTISEALFIQGSSQSNTNTGSTSSLTAGVDNIPLSGISQPDIYLVPSTTFVFPTNSTGVSGNGLTIDAADVTIEGLAISGFGNTHTNGGTTSGHGDISVLRSPSPRTVNITITNCFLSCDPLGVYPAAAERRTKSCGIMIGGNNNYGNIYNNFVAHSGTYGIHFHGNVDNLSVGPAATVGSRYWTISNNRILNIGTNAAITSFTRVSDAILLMKCTGFQVLHNYIDNAEQMGLDLGYNSDSNYISNNTITNFVKTSAFQLQAGIRIGLCSESDTLFRNLINNNTAATYKGGIWLDKSYLSQPGVITKDNINNLISENRIHNNNGSGIVLSNNAGGPAGGCYNNTITRNSIYENVGLGIDLDFNGLTGSPMVTVDDDGDSDSGPNNVQNFPILDSVRRIGSTTYAFYGKAPAGSLIEFFINDGQSNKHGGVTFNYGEGKTFLGSGVEGGPDDLRAGVGSYNVDGNVATNNNNLFAILVSYTGTVSSVDSVTSTATVGRNTSEFGPLVGIYAAMDCSVVSFFPVENNNQIKLNWRAICTNNFLYFDVEHSIDGKSFSRIRTISAKGFNNVFEYEYVHTNPSSGKNYYRLKLVNVAQQVKYSNVVYADLKRTSSEGLEAVNTVFSNNIQVRVKAEEKEMICLQLFNEQGKLVQQKQVTASAGVNFLQLDNTSQLSAGAYFLQLTRDGRKSTRKIIKQ